MDILTNKSYKQYTYTSRYSSFPYYYNTEDNKYIYGLTKHLGKDVTYVVHTIQDYDTLDLLANGYYGRPDLYWIIADFNNIKDPLINLQDNFETLKIPTLNSIYYED